MYMYILTGSGVRVALIVVRDASEHALFPLIFFFLLAETSLGRVTDVERMEPATQRFISLGLNLRIYLYQYTRKDLKKNFHCGI